MIARRVAVLAICAFAGLLPATPIAAQTPQPACRLALLLALDISSSVSQDEDELQRQGLARALVAPEVASAFLANPSRHVALAVMEWSGRDQQAMLLDWTHINSTADLRVAAEQIAQSERSFDEYPTALGYALGYAHTQLQRAPDCAHQTLDISGDGLSNDGFNPVDAYSAYDFRRITVNGLVIGDDAGVLRFYRNEVVRGPGAFVQHAADFTDFERAMRRKLQRELALAVAQMEPVQ